MPTQAHDDYLKSVLGVDVAAARSRRASAPGAVGRPVVPTATAAVGPNNGAPAAGKNAAAFSKARVAWIATRRKVESDISKLQGTFNSAFTDHPKGADLGAAFKARADKVLESLDEALAHKLDEVTGATAPAQHAKLVQEARQIIRRYEATVANDPTIAALDANPFAPLTIRKTMTATLSALSNAIK